MSEFENKKFSFFKQEIDKAKSRDTGLAITLVFLILGLYYKEILYFKIATGTLLVSMIIPVVFKYPAYLWYGFAHFMGTIASKIILTVTYVVMVIPVGLFRKAAGKDSLKLRQWKKSKDSVFAVRNHTYVSTDIDKPY